MQNSLERQARKYTTGQCDAMALALHARTGLPLVLISGEYPDKYGDPGDVAYEDVHAAVKVDDERILDVRGVRRLADCDLVFIGKIDRVVVREVGVGDIECAFTSEGVSKREIAEADRFIDAYPPLSAAVARVCGRGLDSAQ